MSKKHCRIETRKIISSYGGVGSIFETPDGAILIEDFDLWPVFKKNIIELKDEQYDIIDDRLLKRLSHKNGFKNLVSLKRVPVNELSNSYNATYEKLLNNNETVSGKYFPHWFYCPKCNKFRTIKEWWLIWHDSYSKEEKSMFVPPQCGYCAAKHGKKNATKLEQVRFIMTSYEGEISDIPWRKWTSLVDSEEENDSDSDELFIGENVQCCENQDLEYLRSDKLSDLAGIRIRCVNEKCPTKGRETSLKGLFNLKYPKYKAAIRTSNSVYYPIIVNSIYLPTEDIVPESIKNRILQYCSNGKDEQFIFDALLGEYTIDTIRSLMSSSEDYDLEYIPEVEYRLGEFNYFVSNDSGENDELRYTSYSDPTLYDCGIKTLIEIRKLKITSVQIGYTRQEPLDRDTFLSGDEVENKIKPKFTSTYGLNTKYLPAVENFGEGILVVFDNKKVENWLKIIVNYENVYERYQKLLDKCRTHEFKSLHTKFDFVDTLIKFVLVHTYSHLIIKELEFICGYPATSLSERMYVDSSNMLGVLIYTIAGAEGSFGGLSSQAKPNNMETIIKSALEKSKEGYCSSDPICYQSEGHGISSLNYATCYSCTLLPETSCEEYNLLLDRTLISDPIYGFINAKK